MNGETLVRLEFISHPPGAIDVVEPEGLPGMIFPDRAPQIEECWSWWEPVAQSMYGIVPDPPLHPLLRPGQPYIPEGAEIAEMRLFWRDAAIHLLRDGKGYRLVAWRKSDSEVDGMAVYDCRRDDGTVLLKDINALSSFGHAHYPDEWPGNGGAGMGDGKLGLREYYAAARRVAWTVYSLEV